MSEDRQRRFSKNAKVRSQFALEYTDVVRIFGEERAFALSRADTMFSPLDIEKIEAYRAENPIHGLWD